MTPAHQRSLASRGAAPEATADGVHYPATHVAGVYNRLDSRVDDRVRRDELWQRLGVTEAELRHWDHLRRRLQLPVLPDGLIAQFDGYDDLDAGLGHLPGPLRQHRQARPDRGSGERHHQPLPGVQTGRRAHAVLPAQRRRTHRNPAPTGPRLRPLSRLEFDLPYRGHRLRFHLVHDLLDIHARPGATAPVTIAVDDQTHTVHSGTHLRVRPAEQPVGDLRRPARTRTDGTGA